MYRVKWITAPNPTAFLDFAVSTKGKAPHKQATKLLSEETVVDINVYSLRCLHWKKLKVVGSGDRSSSVLQIPEVH